jgi:hypothetical protein
MDILAQVAGSGSVSDQHFDQVAQSVSPEVLAKGVAGAFNSDQTAAIGTMVGQLFGNSSGSQQAGMLNQILATLGPVAAASLAGGVLGKVMAPGSTQISEAQAAQLTPQQVQDVVNHAHQTEPGIADQLASFYAQHAGLLKTLGGAALAVAMVKLKDHVDQS